MKIKYYSFIKLLFFAYFVQVLNPGSLRSSEEPISNIASVSELDLANILFESGDILDGYTTYNRVIKRKELTASYDVEYINALYGALKIATSKDQPNVYILMSKLQIHDKEHCPIVKFEEDILVIDNLPEYMLEDKDKVWIIDILTIFGINISNEDIESRKNSIRVKLNKSTFCPCCKSL